MRRIGILLFLVGLISGFPLIATANGSQAELEVLKQITAVAKHDADADEDGCLWFCSGFSLALGGGCLLGSLSLISSYSYRPSPPLSRLVGKSPEYISVYIDTYKEQRRSVASSAAIVGCALGAATAGCLGFAGVSPWSTAFQESTDKYGHGLNVVLSGISRVAVIKSW
ncbi:hypothetical protein J5I95_17845 [Candidatus Poribacteria bacterium]|nr:hypothetical protein [Candidatus Poribacteria bacterium]